MLIFFFNFTFSKYFSFCFKHLFTYRNYIGIGTKISSLVGSVIRACVYFFLSIFHEKYLFYVLLKNCRYYICIHQRSGRCRGRGVFKNGIFRLTKAHLHLPNRTELKERKFKQELCRRVTTQDDSYRKIYDAVRPL